MTFDEKHHFGNYKQETYLKEGESQVHDAACLSSEHLKLSKERTAFFPLSTEIENCITEMQRGLSLLCTWVSILLVATKICEALRRPSPLLMAPAEDTKPGVQV